VVVGDVAALGLEVELPQLGARVGRHAEAPEPVQIDRLGRAPVGEAVRDDELHVAHRLARRGRAVDRGEREHAALRPRQIRVEHAAVEHLLHLLLHHLGERRLAQLGHERQRRVVCRAEVGRDPRHDALLVAGGRVRVRVERDGERGPHAVHRRCDVLLDVRPVRRLRHHDVERHVVPRHEEDVELLERVEHDLVVLVDPQEELAVARHVGPERAQDLQARAERRALRRVRPVPEERDQHDPAEHGQDLRVVDGVPVQDAHEVPQLALVHLRLRRDEVDERRGDVAHARLEADLVPHLAVVEARRQVGQVPGVRGDAEVPRGPLRQEGRRHRLRVLVLGAQRRVVVHPRAVHGGAQVRVRVDEELQPVAQLPVLGALGLLHAAVRDVEARQHLNQHAVLVGAGQGALHDGAREGVEGGAARLGHVRQERLAQQLCGAAALAREGRAEREAVGGRGGKVGPQQQARRLREAAHRRHPQDSHAREPATGVGRKYATFVSRAPFSFHAVPVRSPTMLKRTYVNVFGAKRTIGRAIPVQRASSGFG
jgi:hypothetical protein